MEVTALRSFRRRAPARVYRGGFSISRESDSTSRGVPKFRSPFLERAVNIHGRGWGMHKTYLFPRANDRAIRKSEGARKSGRASEGRSTGTAKDCLFLCVGYAR